MNYRINPRTIHPPAAKYAHGVLSRGFDQILHSSGVVPMLVWKNIGEILKEAHMGITDIVSVTTYVVLDQDLQAIMKVRDEHLDQHRAASTLVTVPELAQDQWKMEISIIAVK